jgi:hypothetical protein
MAQADFLVAQVRVIGALDQFPAVGLRRGKDSAERHADLLGCALDGDNADDRRGVGDKDLVSPGWRAAILIIPFAGAAMGKILVSGMMGW